MNEQNILKEAIENVLSQKLSRGLLKRVLTNKIKKELYEKLAKEFFYLLLKEKKICLPPGFGSIVVKDLGEKKRKVYSKKEHKMVEVVTKNKYHLIFKPGTFIKQFL